MKFFLIVGVAGVAGLLVALIRSFINAALMCTDEHEAGERRRLREEDATPE